jgi:DNA-binding transcriptional MerR regulator
MTTDERTGAHFIPTYRSGTAARLAGIPVETLRVWERRYQLVGPRLNLRGHRLYSAEDVSRLALIKQLVDLGSPIGSIASLPLASLREMRDAAGAASRGLPAELDGAMRSARVAIVGEALTEQLAGDGNGLHSMEIVATCAEVGRAAELLGGVSADVLAIDLPTLQTDSVALVDALARLVGARRVVVAYRFGSAAAVGAIRARGHVLARLPLEVAELERLCSDASALDAGPGHSRSPTLPLEVIPSRRFDDQSLARLAHASTTMLCECPHHVVELVLSLGSFERYSAECENRSPADAALHRYLKRVAGSARALFEDALVHLARAEGLALPDSAEPKEAATSGAHTDSHA